MRNQSVVLGLGSNLGVPLENLRAALSVIRKSALFVVKGVSSIYESEAQLPPGASAEWQRTFLNAAVKCDCARECTPEDILTEIKRIEVQLGRTYAEPWAPRLIDIDILYWNRPRFFSEKLQIPHARLLERPFALLPLLELFPAADLDLPPWAHGWTSEKPFATVRSRKYFWPRFVGILNVTKDSFSDGGKFTAPEKLIAQAQKLIADGAEVLDIGAESTRPGAVRPNAERELQALRVAFSEIERAGLKIKMSLDCRNSEVAAAVLERYSVDFLNDVTGFASQGMQKLLLNSNCSAFVMHSLTVPPMASEVMPSAENPFHQLVKWWKIRRECLLQAGFSSERLVFDPGIGFGKTIHQNFFILSQLDELHPVQEDIMIGHSRKSFMKVLSDRQAEDRDVETAVVTSRLNLAYVQYLRVHDIKSQQAAL